MTITPTAPLDLDEENRLVALAQAGDKAATAALVQALVRYVRAEARTYAAAEPLLEADDLVSAGLEALLGAIRTFDPTKGARLLTHARPSIALAFSEEVAAYGRAIAVPGRTLRKYRRAVRETDTLADARELARTRDGMDPATFDAVHFTLTAGGSIDEGTSPHAGKTGDNLNGGEGFDWSGSARATADTLTEDANLLGSRGPAPEATAVSRALTAQALAALDEKSRQIVALAYLSGEELTDGQIAERLGVSRPTVTRTRNAALEVMRDALA